MSLSDKNIPIQIVPTEECQATNMDLSQSKSGSNSFYFHCDVYNGRTSYAVCLHTIDAVKRNAPNLRIECPNAMKCGTCRAVNLRAEEEVAGKALFFRDRMAFLAKLDKELEEQREPIRYGQSRPSAGFKPTRFTEKRVEESKRDEQERVAAPARPQRKRGEIDADLAGRSLIGEAIDNMMETESE